MRTEKFPISRNRLSSTRNPLQIVSHHENNVFEGNQTFGARLKGSIHWGSLILFDIQILRVKLPTRQRNQENPPYILPLNLRLKVAQALKTAACTVSESRMDVRERLRPHQ